MTVPPRANAAISSRAGRTAPARKVRANDVASPISLRGDEGVRHALVVAQPMHHLRRFFRAREPSDLHAIPRAAVPDDAHECRLVATSAELPGETVGLVTALGG